MSGPLTLTKAAKALGVPRKELIAWLLRERWLMRVLAAYGKSKGPLIPTLAALANGYLIESYHSVTGSSSYRPGYYQKTFTGALVTEQGLAKLAAEFGPAEAV